MSNTIAGVLVILLAELLPLIGITIGSDALTTTVSTLFVVGSDIWIWFKRVQKGDVTLLGVRKA